MRTDWVLTLFVGAAMGVTLTIACSDDSPGGADAATCDCPAAEPPLAGRIVRTRDTGPIDPNGTAVVGAGCNGGGTLLGGSCRLMSGDRGIFLNEAGASEGVQLFRCSWSSTSAIANTGIAEAICLMPAQ